MVRRLVEFDVSEAIRFILDEHRSAPMRAIRLYELQLAIIMSKRPALKQNTPGKKRSGPPPSERSGYIIWVYEGYFARARAYASARLLEYLESEYEEQSGNAIQLSTAAAHSQYAELHDAFSGGGGWRYTVSTSGSMDFQGDIKEMRYQAKQTSKLIAFSLRFKAFDGNSKKTGGVTSARNTLDILYREPIRQDGCSRFRPDKSISTLKKYWDRHQYVAPFTYLAYFERAEQLLPPDIAKKSFARRLLRSVEDRQGLMNLFARHNAIGRHLTAFRGYVCDAIDVSGLPHLTLEEFDPLPTAIIEIARSIG